MSTMSLITSLLLLFSPLLGIASANSNYYNYQSSQNQNPDQPVDRSENPLHNHQKFNHEDPNFPEPSSVHKDEFDHQGKQYGNPLGEMIQYNYKKIDDLVDYLLGHDTNPNHKREPSNQGRFSVPQEPNHYGHEQKIHDYQVRQGIAPNVYVIAIEGEIICKSGNTYTPISGAMAKIKCPRSHGYNEYNKAPFSVLSPKTNEKGSFVATFRVEELANESVDLSECQIFPDYSPLKSCNTATNNGNYGARITHYRNSAGQKYYTMRPLVYTSSEKPDPVHNYESTASKERPIPGY